MNTFIGVKVVKAMPMTRQEYTDYRGWVLPEDEDGSDAGMLVEYLDGGERNHPKHDGYISWCPLEVFNRANRSCASMSFGHALEAARKGLKIARKGWNGANQFVVMQPELKLPPYNTEGTARKVNDRTAKFIGKDTPLECPPYCCLFNAQGKWVCGWVPSQGDLFADDWYVVEDPIEGITEEFPDLDSSCGE